ncbi:hypothetical protein RLIN73S_03209 [Rhodanobacter lindaniclasticus]
MSTAPDQIALAPGTLQKEWTANGRRYFHYKMEQPMLNFFAYLSARYAVKSVQHDGVAISVYYNPAHAWNVDRMIESASDSLDYYDSHYTPYQLRAIPYRHRGVPGLCGVRAVVRQHDPVLRVDRLHRRPARQVQGRLCLRHHRARSGAPVVARA